MGKTGIGKLIAGADKEVLVDIVRLTQKQSLKGAEGGWKDYLALHDKKLGNSIGDPARRTNEILVAFLDTFPAKLQKFFEMMIKRYNYRKIYLDYKKSPNSEPPQMRLLRLTAEHPEYSKSYAFPSYQEDWELVTLSKLPDTTDLKSMVAIHCEVVLCKDGTEAPVRVCAVDQNLEVIMDRLVQPNKPVMNYRTHTTGVSAEDLDGVTCSLANVQKSLSQILKKGPILIGHRLFNVLRALKIDYPLVVDTARIFNYANLATVLAPSLNDLCRVVLGKEVLKEGIAHNCLEDAKAEMRVVIAKLEHGFDHPINVSSDSVLPEGGSVKLLVHQIPVTMPCQELTRMFPGNPRIHKDVKVRGNLYSTFVEFKNAKEAEEAYKALNGQDLRDSFGRPKKVVVFKRESGDSVTIYVNKVTNKRMSEDINGVAEVKTDGLKKLKTSHDQCTIEKEALVEVVRKAQRQRLQGSKGGWKEFLMKHDKKLGSSVSDPAKRNEEILTAFLKTFSSHVQKYFDKMRKRHVRRLALQEHINKFPESESPELRLALLTAEHPDYKRNYGFQSYNEDWKVMKLGSVSKIIDSKSIIAIDCEMVLCEDGSEAPVRVCAVDRNLTVMMDTLVNPGKPVEDYRTHITGMSAEDLEGITRTLANVQKSLRKILKKGTILIGHSLFFDLRALKIDYPLVIDTAYVFKHADLPAEASPSLNNLCKAVLGRAVREEGATHDCLNDAKATMELVLAKLQHGFNHPIKVAYVSESDLAKLKVHRVPVKVSREELSSLLPQNLNIDEDLRVSGKTYATFVEFKNAKEADEAYQALDGVEGQDSCGKQQKQVTLRRGNGEVVTFYVRKMSNHLSSIERP